MESRAKNSWFRASLALILFFGSFYRSLLIKSNHSGGSFWYMSLVKSILQALFCASTSLYSDPGNGGLPVAIIWKITPALKRSQIGSYLAFKSFKLTISGATYPGVPHLTNKYSFYSQWVASPKSAITQSKSFSSLKMIFSGFKSLCMIFLSCMYSSPSNKPFMTLLIWMGENLCLAWILSYSCPPCRSST